MIRELHLSGKLRKKFGPSLRFEAQSPAEMLRAACIVVRGFEEELREGEWHLKRGARDEAGIHLQELTMHIGLGKTKDVYLIPATKASKKGLGKVLLGAVMIGAAFATGGISIGASAAAAGSAGASSLGGAAAAAAATAASSGIAFVGTMGFIAKLGIVMALGGLSSMLTPKPKFNRGEADRNESFMFSGASNTAVQGDAVPLVYGRVMAGSVVVSAGIDVEQIQSGSSGVTTGDYVSGGWDYGFGYIAAKGGKGGGGSTATEAPNNLQSNNTIALVEMISEGPCYGLADQTDILKSIYLDDVVVRNADDTDNFQGLVVEERFGEATQTFMPGFSNVESEVSVGVQVEQATPIVRAISDTNVDDVRVTVAVPALYTVNTETGAISEASVQFKISVQPNGGSYTDVLTYTISGKTNSNYQAAFRIPLDGTGPWNVKVTRITADSVSSSLQNDLMWSSYTEIVNHRLYYPNRAVIGLKADARQFGSHIPSRTYDYKGRIIKVPSNYDPDTRAYTGIWDGTFTTAWTDNPAWVLYDILTNTRYGLGDDMPEDFINKWVLYEIAQYCDALVPDGLGGTEPRYTINTQIKDRGEAWELLSNIVSVFRGMFYWGAGTLEFTYDHDETPTKIVSKANVLGGKFSYSSGQFRSQHSVVVVAWNDPAIMHRVNYEVVEDPELIAKYGYKVLETTAWGCTSRGQANRVGRWILDTERYGEFLQYKASIDHADVRPGTIIEVNDVEYNSYRNAGRLATGCTTTVLQLDSTLTKGAGGTVRVVLPDGTVEERTVTTGAGTVTSLTVSVAFSDTPNAESMWSYAEAGIDHRLFKVLSVEESGTLEYGITAAYHDPNKFDRVELEIDLPPNDFSTVPTGPLLPPSNLEMTDFMFREGNIVEPGALCSWTAPADPRVTFYEFQAKLSSAIDWGDTYRTSRITGELRSVAAGNWDLRVRSCNDAGLKGIWVSREAIALTGTGSALPSPGTLVITQNADSGTTILSWDEPTDVRPLMWEIRYGATNVYASSAYVGLTQNIEIIIPYIGWWFVTPVFGTAMGTPAAIEAEAADFYSLGTSITNFNNRNDRIATPVVSATIAADGTAVDHVLREDSTVDMSVEWTWAGAEADIDGWEVMLYESASASAYTLGTTPALEQVFLTGASKRAFFFRGLKADSYYTVAVRAYRVVDPDVDADEIIYGTWVKPSLAGENPYRPEANPAFSGDIAGTVNVAASQVANASVAFDARLARSNAAITAPTLAADGTCIDHTNNPDGSVDVSIEWTWGGTESTITGFEVIVVSGTSSADYTLGTNPAVEFTYTTAPNQRGFILYGVSATLYYNFFVRAIRRVDEDINSGGKIASSWVEPSLAAEDPYRPQTADASAGNITSTINGTAASTLTTAATNFNSRNDRNSATVTAPTVTGGGSAVDHAYQLNGSADISFEWVWSGSEADIDGFEIMYRSSSSSATYTVGSSPATETRIKVPREMRATYILGLQPTLYYTFAVRAYRQVDDDIEAGGIKYSSWAQPSSGDSENPYQPSSLTSFAGNVTGSIDSTSAANVAAWSAYANSGLNSDGTVKSNKVLEASIAAGAINLAGYASSTASITQTADSEITVQSEMSGSPISLTSGDVVQVTIILQYEIFVVNPTQDTMYGGQVRPSLVKSSDASATYGEYRRCEEVWNRANLTGTGYFGLKTIIMQEHITAPSTATFYCGWYWDSDATSRVRFISRRYAKMDIPKAAA